MDNIHMDECKLIDVVSYLILNFNLGFCLTSQSYVIRLLYSHM